MLPLHTIDAVRRARNVILVAALSAVANAQSAGVWTLSAGAPCRVHLVGPDGKPVKPPGLPSFNDHFVCEGEARLELPLGAYEYTTERGPEWRRASGRFEIDAGGNVRTAPELVRIADLAAEGWFSGDVHVHRPPAEIPLHLRAEGLSIAPVITVWNRTSFWQDHALPAEPLVRLPSGAAYHLLGCEDERQGGALLYFNLSKPLEIAGAGPELPSSTQFLGEAAARPGAWIDIEKPFWWDVPVWLASGKVRSIGIANNHMCRSRMYEDEAWGRPRHAVRLPAPRGNGFYTQELYYRILNCGFRIPPSAGSASGVLPNPVGYNRAYVKVGAPLTWDAWWSGLAAGRVFVTNGPLLLVEANGKPPGEVFRVESSGSTRLQLVARIFSDDPIESIEVIRDGEIVERLEGSALESSSKGFHGRVDLKPVSFERSGWLLVRAISKVPATFRFASTAPFYVELAGRRSTVHRADVEHFLRWIDERIERLKSSKDLRTDDERARAMAPQKEARAHFEKLLDEAR